MATNLSDDGSAPVDFNLSSTIDENDCKNSGPKEKCFLCKNLRKTFYCKICIVNGDFMSSNLKNPERYADKKLLLLKLQNDKEALSNKCLKAFEKMEVKIRVQTEINQCKGRIKLLMQLIRKKSEVIKKTNKDLEAVKEKNVARVLRHRRNKERVEKLEYYVANNMKTEIKQRKSKVEKLELELKKIIQKNVKDLISYIFPIYKIDAISKSTEEIESTDTVSALAEATRTSYVRGKWVFMDSTGDLHYRIVAPTLPGSGDYSAYSDWVAANKNGVPVNEKLEENQAYNISAALCYTTQLVNLLAFYLDIILPNRLSYVDFYSTDISDNKFYKKVSKLNTNILYLCFSQGVDTSLLNPKHTLCNLLHLVSLSDLGKSEPFEIDSNMFLSLENYGADLKTDECSDDEENDVVPSEWEAIPLVPCPESNPGSTTFSTHQMPSIQATTSMAGGLVTSLASMWRGWTGNRSRGKSQENDSYTLLESQENVFQKISAILSQSSQSTYIGELDDTLLQSTRNLKTNSYIINFGKGPVNDFTNEKLQLLDREKSAKDLNNTKNDKFEQPENMDCSQESVSMLQECYENSNEFPDIMETYADSELEVINIYSDEELEEEPVWKCEAVTMDIGTQTNFEVAYKFEIDEEVEKHAQFMQSVVRLKTVSSSKTAVSNKIISNIIQKDTNSTTDFWEQTTEIPKETVEYILRSSNVDSVFRDTVQILLRHLEHILNNNFLEAALYWKNSVYEKATDMLVDAVENEVGIWRDVDLFLYKNIEDIINDGKKSKNLLLESKTNFIISLCRSTHLSYTSITYTIEQLKSLKQISRRSEASFKDKFCTAYQIKNSYYLLKILESSLNYFKGKITDGQIEKTLVKKSETKTYNVLKMWQKHWIRDERSEENKGEHVWEKLVCEWCDELDEISLHCINNFPLLSMAVGRCATLAKQILKMCHPELVKSHTQNDNSPRENQTEHLDDFYED